MARPHTHNGAADVLSIHAVSRDVASSVQILRDRVAPVTNPLNVGVGIPANCFVDWMAWWSSLEGWCGLPENGRLVFGVCVVCFSLWVPCGWCTVKVFVLFVVAGGCCCSSTHLLLWSALQCVGLDSAMWLESCWRRLPVFKNGWECAMVLFSGKRCKRLWLFTAVNFVLIVLCVAGLA